MSEVENTQLIAAEGMDGFIADLTAARVTSYCSLVPKTEAEKKTLYNAQNNSDKRLADCINETIDVKHIYVEIVNCVNRESGEVNTCPRVVFIDKADVSYQCVSLGIYGAVKKLFQVFGYPAAWKTPLKLKVKQITKGEKKLLTLDVV